MRAECVGQLWGGGRGAVEWGDGHRVVEQGGGHKEVEQGWQSHPGAIVAGAGGLWKERVGRSSVSR